MSSDPFDPTTDLTIRQQEVLNLIMKGLTSEDIAKKLELSQNTVKVHTKVIFEKIGRAAPER